MERYKAAAPDTTSMISFSDRGLPDTVHIQSQAYQSARSLFFDAESIRRHSRTLFRSDRFQQCPKDLRFD